MTKRTESGAHLQMRSGSGRLARRQALDEVFQARQEAQPLWRRL